jgi:hypothetical protein
MEPSAGDKDRGLHGAFGTVGVDEHRPIQVKGDLRDLSIRTGGRRLAHFRSNEEAGDRERSAVWRRGQSLLSPHIVFVQRRRTQAAAVLSGSMTPTHRRPDLALSGRTARGWQLGFAEPTVDEPAMAFGQAAPPRWVIASQSSERCQKYASIADRGRARDLSKPKYILTCLLS